MKKPILPTAVVLVGAVLAGMPVQADTLEDALVSAYATSPQIDAARAQLRATDETVNQALANWRPSVAVSGSAGRGYYEQNGTRDQYRTSGSGALVVTQPLYRGGRTVAATDQAESGVLAGRAALRNAEQTLLLAAATAYANVWREEAVLVLNRNNEKVLERQLAATRDRFEVGEITRTDVSQAEARLAGATASVRRAEGDLESARATYLQVVGMPAKGIDQPKLTPVLPATREDAVRNAEIDNPLVVAAAYQTEAAAHGIDAVRGELLPSLAATGTLSRNWRVGALNARTETAQVLLALTVPLYQKGSVYSRVRAAKHTAGQRAYETDDARRRATESAVQAWEGLDSARAQTRARASQIAAAKVALDGVEREAQVGSRTVIDVLDAEQELLDAQVNMVRAQRNETVAAFQLLSSVGRMTVRGLGLSIEPYDPEAHYRDVRNQWFGGSAAADADLRGSGTGSDTRPGEGVRDDAGR